MCSDAKVTYKNRQKMISKTYTERTSENSLYHKRNEKIYTKTESAFIRVMEIHQNHAGIWTKSIQEQNKKAEFQ